MTGYEAVVAEHQRLRQIRMELNARLVKQIPRKALLKAARKLGILVDGVLCFETEDESSVLMDYCIHEQRELGRNVVDRFLLRRDVSADERTILESMRDCWFSLFKIERTVSGAGERARDVLWRQQLFIVDVNLSHSDADGGVLAARLMPFGPHFISTGTVLPVDADILDDIVEELEDIHFSRRSMDTWSPHERSEFAALILRKCLAHGAAHSVRYA